jgi:hypothetical protein
MINKPFKRTVRQLNDGSYRYSGNGLYVLDKDYSEDPQHYVRAFLLIQEDLLEILRYVDPNDLNDNTISLKIHELLVRTCIEIEANFTAILTENIYSGNPDRFNMANDYCLIEQSHRLSKYEVKLPVWTGAKNVIIPFKDWANVSPTNWTHLAWYQAYNKSKHNRHLHFEKASFRNLLDAVAGLLVLLSAQFMEEDFSPAPKGLSASGPYSYDYDPLYESGIGGYFMVKFPTDWDEADRYDFQWQSLKTQQNKVDQFNYDNL